MNGNRTDAGSIAAGIKKAVLDKKAFFARYFNENLNFHNFQ